jgi:hypothetical protein
MVSGKLASSLVRAFFASCKFPRRAYGRPNSRQMRHFCSITTAHWILRVLALNCQQSLGSFPNRVFGTELLCTRDIYTLPDPAWPRVVQAPTARPWPEQPHGRDWTSLSQCSDRFDCLILPTQSLTEHAEHLGHAKIHIVVESGSLNCI